MGYLPQFLNGDATDLGKALVTATPTSDAARDLLGLGEGDSPVFSSMTVGSGTVSDPAIKVGTNLGIYSLLFGFAFTVSGSRRARITDSGVHVAGGSLIFEHTGTAFRTSITNPSANVLEQRGGTDSQIFRLSKTYTSDTNFERLQFDTTNVAYRIGSAVGSAGGTHRDILIGRWTPDGSWGEQFGVPYGLKLDTSNRLTLSGSITGEGLGLTVDNLHSGGQRAYIRLRGRQGSDGSFRDWTIEKTTSNEYRLNIYPQSGDPLLTCWVHYGNSNNSRLGIGTISPLTRLHVVGGVTLEGLPTTDPAAADRLWNNSGLLSMGEFDIEAAQDALDVGFLNVTEMETTDDYVYYGGVRSGGSWKINRYDAVTLELTSATITGNAGYANLADAWANLETLNYE